MPLRNLSRRLVQSVVAVTAAGALVLAGHGWTPAGADASASSGQPTAAVVDASGVDRIEQQPGWSQRLFDLHAGTGGVAAASLTTQARSSSPLDGDLRLLVDDCSDPWSVTSTGDGYVCAGTETVRIADRPALGEQMPLDGLHLAGGATAYLRAVLTASAGAAPGATATLDYTFTTANG